MTVFNLRHQTIFCSLVAVLISVAFYAFLIMGALRLMGYLPPEYDRTFMYYIPGSFVAFILIDTMTCSYNVFVHPGVVYDFQTNFDEFLDSFHTDTKYLTNAGRRRRR